MVAKIWTAFIKFLFFLTSMFMENFTLHKKQFLTHFKETLILIYKAIP